MLDIHLSSTSAIQLSGRFDASQVARASEVFDDLSTSHVVDFADLEYISSAGLGVLLGTQKRLSETGHSLKLVNMNPYVKNVFMYAGFNMIFEIE